MTPSSETPRKRPVVRPDDVRRSGSGIWIAVLVVVVIAGVLAVVLARGSDDKPPITTETAAVELVAPASGGADDVLPPVEGGLPTVGPQDDPAVGMTVPELSGTGVDGKPLTIGPDGGAKVIVVMAHWCPHCRAEIPRLVEHFQDGGAPKGVSIIGVSTRVDDEAPNYPPSEWLKREGWDFPTLADSQKAEAMALLGVSSFPYFIAVDADGKVVARESGELSTESFDGLVDAARTGKAPAAD